MISRPLISHSAPVDGRAVFISLAPAGTSITFTAGYVFTSNPVWNYVPIVTRTLSLLQVSRLLAALIA